MDSSFALDGFVKVDDDIDVKEFPMFNRPTKRSVKESRQAHMRTEIAIKNRESNIFAEDALMENWMDLDASAKVKETTSTRQT